VVGRVVRAAWDAAFPAAFLTSYNYGGGGMSSVSAQTVRRHIMGCMPDSERAVVLVADGEASVLKNVSSTLEKAGFKVLTAHGGPDVLDVCSHHPDPIQLAIVDMTMAGNRPDLVERLDGSYPGIRFLFTASTDESGNVRRIGRSDHPRGFLQKPFRRSRLLGRVLQVLDAPSVRTA